MVLNSNVNIIIVNVLFTIQMKMFFFFVLNLIIGFRTKKHFHLFGFNLYSYYELMVINVV